MKHHYTDKTLTLECDPEEQKDLREMFADIAAIGACYGTTGDEKDFLEWFIANSELEWIDPEDTGDLTSAPLLGILGEEGIAGITVFQENYGYVDSGHDGRNSLVQPILHRWGYPHYQLRSFLADLAENGKVEFVNSW